MSEEKEKKTNGRSDHVGSIVPEDDDLTKFLNRLWARNEPPERIEVWQMFGRNKAIRGEMIFHEDFKANEKLNVEQVVKLVNEIYEAAQNDCNSSRRESYYQISITDRHRKASPLTRRLGPMTPNRQYMTALQKAGDLDGEDDVDGPVDARALDLKFIQEGLAQGRWDKQRYDRVMGEMLLLQHNIIHSQQGVIDRMFDKSIAFFEKMQEAQDRSLDREVVREREKFKIGLWRDGVRTARNLLPGLFGDNGGAPQNASRALEAGDGNGAANGTNGAAKDPAVKYFGPSPERTLVDNFLSDIDEDEQLSIKLFGDFEEHEGRLKQVKPGIFKLTQYKILVGVREGRYSPDALDVLMPQSGHDDAITPDQVKAAIDAGVTDGIGSALIELVGLRNRRKEGITDGNQPQPE
jgi:hypothetical protein